MRRLLFRLTMSRDNEQAPASSLPPAAWDAEIPDVVIDSKLWHYSARHATFLCIREAQPNRATFPVLRGYVQDGTLFRDQEVLKMPCEWDGQYVGQVAPGRLLVREKEDGDWLYVLDAPPWTAMQRIGKFHLVPRQRYVDRERSQDTYETIVETTVSSDSVHCFPATQTVRFGQKEQVVYRHRKEDERLVCTHRLGWGIHPSMPVTFCADPEIHISTVAFEWDPPLWHIVGQPNHGNPGDERNGSLDERAVDFIGHDASGFWLESCSRETEDDDEQIETLFFPDSSDDATPGVMVRTSSDSYSHRFYDSKVLVRADATWQVRDLSTGQTWATNIPEGERGTVSRLPCSFKHDAILVLVENALPVMDLAECVMSFLLGVFLIDKTDSCLRCLDCLLM